MCSVTHDELWRDDAVHDGAEERRDDSDADEYDRCHELNERHQSFQLFCQLILNQ